MTIISIPLENMTFTDGYVGGMGKSWKAPTEADLENCIQGAVELGLSGKTREEIISILESGKAVKWCKSANFYYDHSYGLIGRKRSAAPVEMVECDCGHSVPRGQRMTASLGTSCPDCYDRMSD